MDLYLSDINYELKTFLIEEYVNKEKPYNSEIYRKIYKYNSLLTNIDCVISSATCYSLEIC